MNKDIFNTKLSEEELTKKIVDFFEEAGKKQYSSVNVRVTFEGKTCRVNVSKMYEGLGALVSFANMKWLSELLGTEKIDLQNENYYPGCDTCDYGSEHSVDFVCQDCNV